MDMLEVDLQVDQCLLQVQVEACIQVVPQRPDPVDLPMHQYPQVVLQDNLQCHPVVLDIQGLMEDLLGQDQCIQNGEVEDLGEVPATHLGLPTLQRVLWLGLQYQPHLFRATHSKVHLDGAQDFPDLVRNMVVAPDLVHNMVDLLVAPDLDHMVRNIALDQDLTPGLDLKDQAQGRHTDLTK